MIDLIERIEAASGPDRVLDSNIYAILNKHMMYTPTKLGHFYDPSKTVAIAAQKYHISGGATAIAPRYTASLDAAMTLVPKGWCILAAWNPAHPRSYITLSDGPMDGQARTWGEGCGAATPALALCAAALRARMAMANAAD